jgi:hypothetical protein
MSTLINKVEIKPFKTYEGLKATKDVGESEVTEADLIPSHPFMDQDPTVRISQITENDAVNILKYYNKNNRDKKTYAIKQYFLDILNDDWAVTNQGFGFANTENGSILIDGQNRLTAFVKACKQRKLESRPSPTMTAVVVSGLPIESQKKCDRGVKRSLKDIFFFEKEAKVNSLALSLVRNWIRSENNWCPYSNITDLDVYDFLSTNESNVLETAATFVNGIQGKKSQGVFLACAKYLRENPEDAREFMSQLVSGANLGDGDPALILRNRVLGTKAMGGSGPFLYFYEKTCHAIQMFHAGERFEKSVNLRRIKSSKMDWDSLRNPRQAELIQA